MNCFVTLIFLLVSFRGLAKAPNFEQGDIVFQTSQSNQSRWIQLATGSRWTHVGIVFKRQNSWHVYEAGGAVDYQRLDTWINKGLDRTYIVKRLRDQDRPNNIGDLLFREGKPFYGKLYDQEFRWDDSKIYCSELVWKMFERGAGLVLGEPKPLKDFDLSHPDVKKALRERYGENIPYDELMIAPGGLYDSERLITVFDSRERL